MDLNDLKVSDLKKLCKQNKIPEYQKLKKSQLIDLLHKKKDLEFLPDDIQLDLDQQEALYAAFKEKMVLINAGPGTGKTLTLCHIVKNAALNKKRILVLVFNNEVEKRIRTLLKNMSVKLLTKKSSINEDGVRVSTCYQCAFDICKETFSKFFSREQDNDKIIIKSISRIEEIKKFDYLIIDEAHDITENLIDFCEELKNNSEHTVLAGDFKQEISDTENWFGKLYQNVDCKKILRFNHRSCSRIVDLLNDFATKCFPEFSDSVQKCVTEKKGRVRFYNVEDVFLGLYENILKYPDAMIIAPVSVSKYGCLELFAKVNQMLFDNGYHYKIKILKENDKIIDDESFIFAASSIKVKGLERKSVILIKGELDYKKYGNISDNLLKRKIFTAISRAQRNLIVIHSSNVQNDIFSMLPLSENVTRIKSEIKVTKINKTFNEEDCIELMKNVLKLDVQDEIKDINQIDNQTNGNIMSRKVKLNLGLPNEDKNQLVRNFIFNFYSNNEKIDPVDKELEEFMPFFPYKDVKYSKKNSLELLCLRSSISSNIKIKIDEFLISKKEIIDVCYTENVEKYQYIAALRCNCYQKKAIIYNLYTGLEYKFKFKNVMIPYFWVPMAPIHLLRIKHFVDYAKNVDLYKRVKLNHNIQGKILVTFDLETWNGYPKKGCTLLEAGGIACYTNGQVISLIHDNYGSEMDKDGNIYYPSEEIAQESSRELYKQCKKWSSQFSNREISLKWAANESDYLIIDANPFLEIDVMKIYEEWRKINNINRSKQDGYRSLTDCAFDIFHGIIPFRAHDAFEDSFMTLVCFMAMIEF